jgi:hypothetical protein
MGEHHAIRLSTRQLIRRALVGYGLLVMPGLEGLCGKDDVVSHTMPCRLGVATT